MRNIKRTSGRMTRRSALNIEGGEVGLINACQLLLLSSPGSPPHMVAAIVTRFTTHVIAVIIARLAADMITMIIPGSPPTW
ncbi:hypothetical protein, partial [Pseudomonas putida]|uniref:hypothetical protein n=1 Tax=Pseudomonas putida TaxID=303 RepID=UPI001ED9842F